MRMRSQNSTSSIRPKIRRMSQYELQKLFPNKRKWKRISPTISLPIHVRILILLQAIMYEKKKIFLNFIGLDESNKSKIIFIQTKLKRSIQRSDKNQAYKNYIWKVIIFLNFLLLLFFFDSKRIFHRLCLIVTGIISAILLATLITSMVLFCMYISYSFSFSLSYI